MGKRIGAIILTYNRIEKLKKALDALDRQEVKPAFVLVYDNHSTDGTEEYLDIWKQNRTSYEKIVSRGERNSGGSGGFHEAMRLSLDKDYDWLYVSDDDAYADERCFLRLSSKIDEIDESVGAICGSVIEHGKINCNHRRHVRKNLFRLKEVCSTVEEYEKEEFSIDLFSYVGCCIKKEALFECGLTNKDYFIWFDDTEHSYRIRERYRILCIPCVKIYHDVGNAKQGGVNWKNYYGLRNALFMYKEHTTGLQFFTYMTRFKLKKMKYFFKDKKLYRLYRCALRDFYGRKSGISDRYYPGAQL